MQELKLNAEKDEVNFTEFYSKILICCPGIANLTFEDKKLKLRATLRHIFVKIQTKQEKTGIISVQTDPSKLAIINWNQWIQSLSNDSVLIL